MSSRYDDLLKGRKAPAEPERKSTHRELLEMGWRRFYVMLAKREHQRFKKFAVDSDMDMAELARAAILKLMSEQPDREELERLLESEES